MPETRGESRNGDYRLGNVILARGSVNAVLEWGGYSLSRGPLGFSVITGSLD